MLTFSSRPRPRNRRDGRPRQPAGLAPLAPPVDPIPVDSVLPEEPMSAEQRGWHNSSMELRRGLEIVEEVPLDTLPDDLRDLFGRRVV